MNRLIYYLFIKPISLLPFFILYRISDLAYLLVYRLFKYRVKVVAGNLERSFPEKSKKERKQIERKFYAHFFDVIVESIKQFSISRAELEKRCKVNNLDVVNDFAKRGESVFVLAGHCGNWEYAVASYGMVAAHQTKGIYHPLKNKFWDQKIQESRGKYGLGLISKKNLDGYFERIKNEVICTLFGTDQSPSNPYKAYWTEFLNQDTAVFIGAERYAKKYNQPLIWGTISKFKRGYYQISFQLITDKPQEWDYGKITEAHTKILEKEIRECPHIYLWTHKRWKRTKPADYDEHIKKLQNQSHQ